MPPSTNKSLDRLDWDHIMLHGLDPNVEWFIPRSRTKRIKLQYTNQIKIKYKQSLYETTAIHSESQNLKEIQKVCWEEKRQSKRELLVAGNGTKKKKRKSTAEEQIRQRSTLSFRSSKPEKEWVRTNQIPVAIKKGRPDTMQSAPQHTKLSWRHWQKE